MNANLEAILYLVAAVAFIIGLKRLGSPRTARNGNMISGTGMALAIVVTLIDNEISWTILIAGAVVGSVVGGVLAMRVKMTAMPQMVAAFNGFGGLASALVVGAEFLRGDGHAVFPVEVILTMILSVFIGAITFTGSMIAYAKLQGLLSGSPITYNMGTANASLLGGAISFSASPVAVPANSTATVDVTLSLSAAAVAALPAATISNFGAIVTIRGAVTATPTAPAAGIYTLRVPFIAAPRGLSDVDAGPLSAYTKLAGGIREATLPLLNSGIHGGTADLYAWGIHDGDDITGAEDGMDIRDVGVQALPGAALGGSADDRSLVFAVNTYGMWSNPSVSEIDIAIDLQNNGVPDFFVVGVDFGAVLAGSFDGRYASFIFDADGNLINLWVASAPMNGSTMLLPTLASDIGLDPDVNSTKFNYAVAAFSIVPGGLVDVTGAGTFRSHQPPVSSGDFASLVPSAATSWTLSVDKGKQASAPQLGWLVVTHDDANGAAQTDQVPLGAIP